MNSFSSRFQSLPLAWLLVRRSLDILDGAKEVYLPEGASCVLALLTLGLAAIGRPSARMKAESDVFAWLVELLVRIGARRVVILGERDASGAGIEGPLDLKKDLDKRLPDVEILVRVPGRDAQDTRPWLRAVLEEGASQ